MYNLEAIKNEVRNLSIIKKNGNMVFDPVSIDGVPLTETGYATEPIAATFPKTGLQIRFDWVRRRFVYIKKEEKIIVREVQKVIKKDEFAKLLEEIEQ